ncbi:TetR/AcrR family transcriptional regulator [Amycolatopsis rubida]|uniref:DNA-binding transcriptional regulator, AcrR family n=1 Tax=Amycolatopsis rubida TaxID=112413 RepID=A0A1I5VCU3_9PSEU|nr:MULTISPECIES: TetR/AcrR family transcriptional regulator [Amycolatopsis]MYW90045.1 TetR family transcriptional regulator [Amycolatopsis rubida]NEC55022.1 TetR/AcrR family transcriptional regulator [Amycolatopsis rubida]OAP21121.1 HTH-type transcriptional repressor KstR2 [Amycolatopsis sp. M39]SFQ05167.1 DNA-binding transcriptional regulator, AcrR family [Amycolatopsis rubida]
MTGAAVFDSARPRYSKLIEIATELFSSNGYQATTIRQIAGAMEIKSASLYSHVGSKAEILREIVLDVAREFTDSALAAVAPAHTGEDQLRALCRAHMRVMTDRASAVIVYFHNWRTLSDEHQREIISLRRRYEGLFRAAMRKAIAEGAYRETDVAPSVRVLLGALNWTYEWRSPRRRSDPDILADEILGVVAGGLRRTDKRKKP